VCCLKRKCDLIIWCGRSFGTLSIKDAPGSWRECSTHTHTHTKKFTSRNTLTPGLHFQGLDTQHSLREGRQGWIEKLSVSLSHTLTLPEDSVTQNHWEWNGMLKNQLSRSSICLCASETYKWESVKYMTNEVTGSTLCIEELIFEI